MTFEELSFKDKVDHIWEYYRWHIIITGIVLLMLGSILNVTIFNPPAEPILDITVRLESYHYNYDYANQLSDQLIEQFVTNPDDETINLELLEIGEDMDPNMVMASEAKFIGKAETSDLDLIIVSEPYYISMSAEGYFLDIGAIADQTGYAYPEDAFAVTEGPDGLVAYGFNINELPGLAPLIVDEEMDYYVGLFVKSEQIDRAMAALASLAQ